MKLKLLLAGIVLSSATLLQAQNKEDLSPCGTNEGRLPWLVEYQKSPQAYPKSNDVLYVPITVHVVGNTDGSGYFQFASVLDAFCTLNTDFEPAGIQFFIEGDILYHANSTWYDHTFQQGAQMMNQSNVANTINCYIVGSPAGNCGYSSYNRGIALAKTCMGPGDHTWAHEVGHYLSLPHPFSGWEGEEWDYSQPAPDFIGGNAVERVDGFNCQNAGDGFCDTPADYLNFRWSCDLQSFSNTSQKDPTGAEFNSDGSFFMSYSLDACANRFSDDQIDAMQANLLDDRPNLLYNQTPMGPIFDEPLTVISPLEGDSIPTYNSVTFAWEPIQNAENYMLEITIIQTFAVTLYRYHVEGTSITINDLEFANKKYYWRLRAYNPWYTCPVTTSINSFKTGSEVATAVHTIEQVQSLRVQPNPVPEGHDLLLNLTVTEPVPLEINLLSIAGQTVYRQEMNVAPGNQVLNIPTADLPSGLYFVQLRSANGVLTEKVVVRK